MLRKTSPERDLDLEPIKNPDQVTGFSSPAQDYKQDRLHIVTPPKNRTVLKGENS